MLFFSRAIHVRLHVDSVLLFFSTVMLYAHGNVNLTYIHFYAKINTLEPAHVFSIQLQLIKILVYQIDTRTELRYKSNF